MMFFICYLMLYSLGPEDSQWVSADAHGHQGTLACRQLLHARTLPPKAAGFIQHTTLRPDPGQEVHLPFLWTHHLNPHRQASPEGWKLHTEMPGRWMRDKREAHSCQAAHGSTSLRHGRRHHAPPQHGVRAAKTPCTCSQSPARGQGRQGGDREEVEDGRIEAPGLRGADGREPVWGGG